MSHKHALTIKGEGVQRALKSLVGVSIPFTGDPKLQKDIIIKTYQGIWDTGATNTVITKKIVNELNLQPTGKTDVDTANGKVPNVDTYLVNINLPMNVNVQGVTVTEGNLPSDEDILIGMDIITLGDFTITNLDGKTKMTFGIPSIHSYDYVERVNENNTKLAAKQKCPCGSGKKHIYCHGKQKNN